MKILATLCILVIGVPAVIGICLYPPINNLMSACKVRNLTVYDTHRNLLTNDASCNNTLSKWSYNLDSPFMVNFTFPLNREYKVGLHRILNCEIMFVVFCKSKHLGTL